MKLRTLPVSMATALFLISTAQPLLAAPFNRTNPTAVHAAKVRTVSFQVRNDTHEAMSFKAGDQDFTLKAGATLNVKLPAGVPLTAETASPHYAVGDVLATVGKQLQGNTLVFG